MSSSVDVGRVAARTGVSLWLAFLYAFLYAPLVITVVFSFSEAKVQTLPWSGTTTNWYSTLAHDQDLLEALRYSFLVSGLAVACAVVCGCGFALAADAMPARLRAVFLGLVAVPLVLPGIVLGLSLVALFQALGVQLGLLTIVAGHASFVTPVVLFIVLNRLRQLDPTLAQASRDLGAGPWRTFWHITLPSVRVALLAGALLAFTLSFDEVATTVFLAGTQTTLPVFVWNLLRFGFTPEVNAVFTLIAVGSILVIVCATRLLMRSSGSRRLGDLTAAAP